LTDAIRADLDRQFPAVGVMKRIQRGGLPAPSDIEVLEPLVKSRCGQQAFGARKKLVLCLKKLKARADMGRQDAQAEFEEITLASDSLYALLLAYDIQAQQKRELADAVVCDWNGECGLRTSGFLRCLGNASYIKALRQIMPLPRVGDPVLERRIRAKHLRSARDLRKKAAFADGIATKNVQLGDGGHSELEWLDENLPQE
jgi:hypothetical protein